MSSIPYGRQHITEEDISAVVETLQSDYITQGPKVAEFEEAFANYVGAKYAVAVCNGTSALHLSALALRIKPGDKIITTPITFVASANCVRYCGGELVFADIDPENYLLDISKVKELLENAPKGTYKGIIPVDFSGQAVDLEEFRKLANEYKLWIIEDASHAPGGYFTDQENNRQYCGNGKFADLAIFSFHPVKHIASGEGGMITTNNKKLYEKILKLRTHGITKNFEEFRNSTGLARGTKNKTDNAEAYPGWYMEMQELGYNYRLSDIHAALGHSQLHRADESLEKRKDIAEIYFKAFKEKEYIKGQSGLMTGHAYHFYIIEVKNRLGLYNYLRKNGILCQVHYFPCHLMPYYFDLGWRSNDLPLAENYYKNCLSLPLYPILSRKDQFFVIDKIQAFYDE